MTKETLIQAERLIKVEKRLTIIEKFLDDQFNFYWITDGCHTVYGEKTKENPQPVKVTGEERDESLRNLAARES